MEYVILLLFFLCWLWFGWLVWLGFFGFVLLLIELMLFVGVVWCVLLFLGIWLLLVFCIDFWEFEVLLWFVNFWFWFFFDLKRKVMMGYLLFIGGILMWCMICLLLMCLLVYGVGGRWMVGVWELFREEVCWLLCLLVVVVGW